MGKGFLKVELYAGDYVLPVKAASVLVKDGYGNVLYNLPTDENGVTQEIPLEAPDKRDLNNPNYNGYYFYTYDVEVPYTEGYKKVMVNNVEIYDTITTLLPIQMQPIVEGEPDTETINIPLEHGVDLPGGQEEGYPEPGPYYNDGSEPYVEEPSAYEERISPTAIIANEVVIPEYITVHLGSPNANAQNVRVPFKDYIKNVASSEIFPFWEETAIVANVCCQISFALNRVYTVWYRSRGKDFDITNSTAFDQFFVNGRDIFQNISRIVDEIFNQFIRRQGRREPFFASYCNGTTATCAGLSQNGSQSLALQGYTTMQILKYYYPNDIQIVESNNFSSQSGTFPGTSLQQGDTGSDVLLMQQYLNRISGNWYIQPIVPPNGRFEASTKATVIEFQKLFNLVPDGIIGKSTWYFITQIYIAAAELAELTSEGERLTIGATPPTVTIQSGARGEYVVELQFILNMISSFFPTIPYVVQNGVFRDNTKRAVVEFQKEFGLTTDGVVGPATWKKLYDAYNAIEDVVIPPVLPPTTSPQFPGTPLRVGSRGNDVLLMQTYLNAIAKSYPSIPTIVADGVFGPATQAAVIAFQREFGLSPDGIIGSITWYKIVDVYNNLLQSGRPEFPGTALRIGSRGDSVMLMQNYLNAIAKVFPVIPSLSADGVFGTGTQASVIAFQRLLGLTADGIIGSTTWNKIVDVYNSLPKVSSPPYPGAALRLGSTGNNVIIMQTYLNQLATIYPSIPTLVPDGVFGARTQQAVIEFQKQYGLTADGVIGNTTWNTIVSAFNLLNMNMNMAMATPSNYANNNGNYNGFDQLAKFMTMAMFKRF